MDSQQVLSSLAKFSKSRVRPIEGFFSKDGGELIAAAYLRTDLLRGEMYATQTNIIFDVRKIDQLLYFTINRDDGWHKVFEELEISAHKIMLYENLGPELVKEWMSNPDNFNLIVEIELLPDEFLHVYGNGVWLSVGLNRDFKKLLYSLGTLINAFPPAPTEDYLEGFEDLPDILQPLSKYFKVWDVSDDQDRAEVIQKARKKQREAVCAAVEPFFPEISKYLDTLTEGNEPQAALRLGYLAEAVAEILISEA